MSDSDRETGWFLARRAAEAIHEGKRASLWLRGRPAAIHPTKVTVSENPAAASTAALTSGADEWHVALSAIEAVVIAPPLGKSRVGFS